MKWKVKAVYTPDDAVLDRQREEIELETADNVDLVTLCRTACETLRFWSTPFREDDVLDDNADWYTGGPLSNYTDDDMCIVLFVFPSSGQTEIDIDRV
jgi:hypothetical protein